MQCECTTFPPAITLDHLFIPLLSYHQIINSRFSGSSAFLGDTVCRIASQVIFISSAVKYPSNKVIFFPAITYSIFWRSSRSHPWRCWYFKEIRCVSLSEEELQGKQYKSLTFHLPFLLANAFTFLHKKTNCFLRGKHYILPFYTCLALAKKKVG